MGLLPIVPIVSLFLVSATAGASCPLRDTLVRSPSGSFMTAATAANSLTYATYVSMQELEPSRHHNFAFIQTAAACCSEYEARFVCVSLRIRSPLITMFPPQKSLVSAYRGPDGVSPWHPTMACDPEEEKAA